MNRNSNLYKSIVLALAATALAGKVAVAEGQPQSKAAPVNTKIVMAKAAPSKAVDDIRTETNDN